MIELPDLDAMDPDDWQHAVNELAERLDGEIQDVLAEHTTPGEAKKALFPVLEPYFVDSDGGTNPARLDVWTDDGRLCIGAPGIDYAPVVYDEERGFWWYDSEEPERAELSPDEAHRRIAEYAVSRTSWGDPNMVNLDVARAERQRRFAAPYLGRIEQALDEGDPTAADLREALSALLDRCESAGADREVVDVSPDAHRTHLKLLDRGEVSGHLLAADPGTSLERDDLAELFNLDDLEGAVVATDHLRFRDLQPDTSGLRRFRLPAEMGDDVAAYNRAVREVVSMLDYLVRASPITDADEYLSVSGSSGAS